MDVRYSAEQTALRASAVALLADLAAGTVSDLDDEGRRVKLDAAVAAAGWRELRSPGAEGAPLGSGVEACILAEELGRAAADTPYIGPTLAADLRRRAGAPPVSHAETVVLAPDLRTLAGSETFRPLSSGFGSESLRPGTGIAVDTAGATTALLLDADGGEFALAERDVIGDATHTDLTRPCVPLQTDSPAPLGPLTADAVTAVTALGLALTAADLVGSMRGAVALATDYARERKQYGRAIGSFQAVQHLLADAFVLMEGSRSAVLHAAWAVDALPPAEALAAAATAKAYAARAARTVCETGIQVHGGIGNTWECFAHVHLRRALLSTDILGGAAVNMRRLLTHRGVR